jgi:hypothetical protein
LIKSDPHNIQLTMFGKSIAVISSLALALHTTASLAATIPSASGTIPEGLWEYSPDGRRVTLWVSKINATMFGVDAEDFDAEIWGTKEDLAVSVEVTEKFARVWSTGDVDAILVAFLNQTTGGGMDPKKPFDRHFLCNDLGCPMNKGTPACDDIDVTCWGDMRAEL